MKLSDVRRTAAYLGITPATLYRWATTRKVPHGKLGDRPLLDLETIRRWGAERATAEQAIKEFFP